MRNVSALPTGTVTFLFSDIEGSTRLIQHLGDQYPVLLNEHHRLLRDAFQQTSGCELEERGDSFFVAFSRATDAVAAAAAAQRALQSHAWPAEGAIRVRIGLHTGEPALTPTGYVGLDVHRAARISAAGQGGQVLLSQTTRDLIEQDLLPGASLRDLGEHRLKDLQYPEHLYQLVLPGLLADFPPLRSLDAHRQNLPVQLTPLLGREQELATLRERLLREEVRLLTLTGPGGAGKTRLGLQVAADLVDVFEDGIFFAELASISDSGLLASAIAHTLGVHENHGQPLLTTLAEWLREKRMLLLLDNFEQILDAAPLVAELLTAAPRLKVLVTSRTVLRLRGEHEFPVPPLTAPDPKRLPPLDALSQYAAVELFIQRATAARPDFQVTNENAPAVAEICHRLDGLPLAIELAAARIRLFSPQGLLPRLTNRLKLLVGGPRDLPARQQTLRSTIGWSYDLLDEQEKTVFRRLSVFKGGFTLEAAEAVCDPEEEGLPLLEGLSSLCEKSLLLHEEATEGESRFSMLETLREYGQESLTAIGELPLVQRHHAAWFLTLAETMAEIERHVHPEECLDRLELEHGNLRAALEWAHATTGEEETELRLAGALWEFWRVRGYLSEGRRWLEDALRRAPGDLHSAARAMALYGAAGLSYDQGDVSGGNDLMAESVALYRKVGDKRRLGRALHWWGGMLADTEDQTAIAMQEEGLALLREVGDRHDLIGALNDLGETARSQADYSRAVGLYEEGLALAQEVGVIAHVLMVNLAYALYAQGDTDRSAALFRVGLEHGRRLGDRMQIALSLIGLAGVWQTEGEARGELARVERAARLLGAVDSLLHTLGTQLQPLDRRNYDLTISATKESMEEEAFSTAWAEGRAMGIEQAIAGTLEETG